MSIYSDIPTKNIMDNISIDEIIEAVTESYYSDYEEIINNLASKNYPIFYRDEVNGDDIINWKWKE